jgi:hypothetical protein
LSYKNKPDPHAKRDRQAAFLETYEKCGTVTEACEHIGISRSAVQRWRQDPGFVEQYGESRVAFADHLESMALARISEPQGNRGSDVLLIAMLNAHRPELYRPANAPVGESNAVTLLKEWRRVAKEEHKRNAEPDDGSTDYQPLDLQLDKLLRGRG